MASPNTITQLRATIRTEGFGEVAKGQLKQIVEDVIDEKGSWQKGRDPLDLLSLVQLFKMLEFRVHFLHLLLNKVPMSISVISMELLADLCRVALREANAAGDMQCVTAMFCIGIFPG